MLATRFIIALCPATPIYLSTPHYSTQGAITRVKSEAFAFETFEAAMEVAQGIVGWGGAQRVEQVAVEVEDTRVTLDTPESRIEVRDNATAQYNAAIEAGYAERNAAEEVAKELRSLGIKVGVDYRDGASCPVTLYLADHLGNTLQLDFDPMVDGFDITEATCLAETEAQHEAEPADAAEDGDLLAVVAATAESLNEQVRLNAHPVELVETLTDLLTDLRLACLAHGIDFATALRRSEMHAGAETVACDGCGATDAEPCGDPEGFAFCAACRAKDAKGA